MAARNGMWQSPPPTIAPILNLPRSSRRFQGAPMPNPGSDLDLETLLGREIGGIKPSVTPAAVESRTDSSGEERWRFQAEILRAECNFLRMEREVALRKLERNRAQMEVTLRSAMETLVSDRRKIDGSEVVGAALDERIEELEEKLEELCSGSTGRQRRSKGSWRTVPLRSGRRNFDRKASSLSRRLEKMEDDTSVKDIQEISVLDSANKNAEPEEQHEREENDMTPASDRSIPKEMELLRRKMEGLSRGMLERMEECSHLLSANDSSTTSSKSDCDGSSHKAIGYNEAVDNEDFLQHQIPQQQQQQQQLLLLQEEKPVEEEAMDLPSCCSCKDVVGRIMQQVRAESEQWSEMQEMLDQVRIEMEQLRSSRDHWQRRAIASEINFHSQHAHKLEWKQRAQSSERNVIELQRLVKDLQKELQPLKTKLLNAPSATPPLPKESLRMAAQQNQQIMRPLNSYTEEKHVLVCHLKSQNNLNRRSPLQNIDNISPLLRARR